MLRGVHGREGRLGIKHHPLVCPLGCELGICRVEIRKLVGYLGGKGLGLLLGKSLEVSGIKWGGGDGRRPAALGLLLDWISVGQLVRALRMGRWVVACRALSGVHLGPVAGNEHGHGGVFYTHQRRRRRGEQRTWRTRNGRLVAGQHRL